MSNNEAWGQEWVDHPVIITSPMTNPRVTEVLMRATKDAFLQCKDIESLTPDIASLDASYEMVKSAKIEGEEWASTSTGYRGSSDQDSDVAAHEQSVGIESFGFCFRRASIYGRIGAEIRGLGFLEGRD